MVKINKNYKMIKNNNNTMICFKKITRKMNKYIKNKNRRKYKKLENMFNNNAIIFLNVSFSLLIFYIFFYPYS